MDDFFWTAHFCGDTYYTGQDTVKEFLEKGLDGPSAGQTRCDWPIWDPRYYFLTVLSIRMYQVTAEWTVLVQVLESYLDSHVSDTPLLQVSLIKDFYPLTIVRCLLSIIRAKLIKSLSQVFSRTTRT